MPKQTKTIGDAVEEFQKLERAKKLALEYSREIPKRPTSPYGQLATDTEAIKEAFRLCYEELLKRKFEAPKSPAIQRLIDEVQEPYDASKQPDDKGTWGGYNRTYHRHNR